MAKSVRPPTYPRPPNLIRSRARKQMNKMIRLIGAPKSPQQHFLGHQPAQTGRRVIAAGIKVDLNGGANIIAVLPELGINMKAYLEYRNRSPGNKNTRLC